MRQLVDAAVGDAVEHGERGSMTGIDGQKQFLVTDTFRACPLGVRMFCGVAGGSETLFACRTCGSDPRRCSTPGGSNHILQPMLDGKQLLQALVIGFGADRIVYHRIGSL